jgi:hypothetical protein
VDPITRALVLLVRRLLRDGLVDRGELRRATLRAGIPLPAVLAGVRILGRAAA